jgi:hypothetical protein
LKDVGRAAVDAALSLVRPGVDLSFDFGTGGASVCTDGLVLERVLAHLLKNACEATSSGDIVLRLTHVEEGVNFAVEDSGCGMEMDDLQYFQRYSTDLKAVEEMTLEAAILARKKLKDDLLLSSGNEGLGIGLSLSYWLVHSLGGELQGESSIGRGTKFHFDLPRSSEERDSLASGDVYRPIGKGVMRSASVQHSLMAYNEEQAKEHTESPHENVELSDARSSMSSANHGPSPDASPSLKPLSSTKTLPRPRLAQQPLYEFEVQALVSKPGAAKMTMCGVFEATKVRGEPLSTPLPTRRNK